MENTTKKKRLIQWVLTFAFIPTWLIIAGICQVIVLAVYGLITNSLSSIGETATKVDLTTLLLMQGSMFIASLGTSYLFWTIIQKHKFQDIGLKINRKNMKESIPGFITGIVLIATITIVLIFSGNLKFQFAEFHWKYILGYIVLFLMVSFNEELVSRGFLLGNISLLTNKYLALILVALLFSFAHFFNANISIMGKINIFLAGVLLGTSYIYNRSLWFPMGLHFSWNFFLGPVAGSNVSGNKMLHTIFKQEVSKNNLITGGDFGFEGSIILSGIVILLIGLVGFIYHRKSKAELLNMNKQQL